MCAAPKPTTSYILEPDEVQQERGADHESHCTALQVPWITRTLFPLQTNVRKDRIRPAVRANVRFSPDVLPNLQLVTSLFSFPLMQITVCSITRTSFSCLGYDIKEYFKNFTYLLF